VNPACAKCGTHGFDKLRFSCFLDAGVKVRCCDEEFQVQHLMSAADRTLP